jgi:hypothetical protein
MEAQPPRALIIPPMGVGELLDSAFTLARRHFRLLAIIAAWGLVPGYALQALIVLLAESTFPDESPTVVSMVAGLIGTVISSVATGLATIAVIVACLRLVSPRGPDLPTASESYREAVSRLPVYIGFVIIIIFAMVPLVLLVVTIPITMYISIRWGLGWIAIVAERSGPINALGRSWAITKGSWWHTLGVLFLAGLAVAIIQGVVIGVIGALFAILAFAVNITALTAVLTAVASIVGGVVSEPLSVAVAVVLYYELRARAEGFDLEQRLQQLAPPE